MATIQGAGSVGVDRAFRYAWGALAKDDVGNSIKMPRFSDKTVQATGTFGTGGAIAMEGSNDNTNWFTLTDHTGTAISLTSTAPGAVIAENPDYIRPNASAGDGGTALAVRLIASGGH